MKTTSTILALGICAIGFAQNHPAPSNLNRLGSLIRSNAQGDYKYPGASKFSHDGTRSYVLHFATKLASKQSDIATYEDVMMQGIMSWENQFQDKGFSGDLASAFALYTLTNVNLAKGADYKDYLLPNLVAQNRKAFMSGYVASLPNAKKQEMYDYMIAESVYLRAVASTGHDTATEQMLKSAASKQVQASFGLDASSINFNETGTIL